MAKESHFRKWTIQVLLLTIFISTIGPQVFAGKNVESIQSPSTSSTALNMALQWLAHNQSLDGSYGTYYDHITAAAAYALWLNNTQSARAKQAYNLLVKNLINNVPYQYTYGEADIPGIVLYSVAASQNNRLINVSLVASNILQFHDTNGGFKGWYPSGANGTVTSSVDTAEALRGLIAVRALNASIQQSAINYLFSLQNSDGSFNLTSSESSNRIDALGPEPISITALVLLALKDASYAGTNTHVSKALDFLSIVSTKNFVTAVDNSTVYGASLSALVFTAYNRSDDAARTNSWIVSKQDNTGGFSDKIRSSRTPNALDTAWAAIALEQPQAQPTAPLQPQNTNIEILAGVLGSVLLVVAGIFLVLRRRMAAHKVMVRP